MEKNAKIGTVFYKERKRKQRLERSFEKNGCPTLSTKSWQSEGRMKLFYFQGLANRVEWFCTCFWISEVGHNAVDKKFIAKKSALSAAHAQYCKAFMLKKPQGPCTAYMTMFNMKNFKYLQFTSKKIHQKENFEFICV